MSDKWILYIKGAGEGCDYTIGCNQRIVSLKSTMPEDLAQEVKDEIAQAFYDDTPPANATLYRIAEIADAKPVIETVQRDLEAEKKQRALDNKRAEFERLKKELGA